MSLEHYKHKFRRVGYTLAASLLLALQIPFIVPTASAEGMMNEEEVTEIQTTQPITAKALDDHECNETEWHFIINQIDDEANAPASIFVTWDNNDTETVPLDKFTGGAAHYATTSNLDSTVKSATATIYSGWGGEFNLSHGPCEEEEDKGSIKIIKDAQPDDAQDFSFTTTGSGLSNFELDDDSNGTLPNYKLFSELSAGTYTVTEGSVMGWSLESITCSAGTDKTIDNHTLTINLSEGQNVICTFVNEKEEEEEEKGWIKIIKDAQPDDAQDFSFTTTGSGLSNFGLDDDSNGTLPRYKLFTDLAAGTYTVTEGDTEGWMLKDISCSQGADINVDGRTLTIHLEAGDTVTCTFVNEKEEEEEENVPLCHATGSESNPFEKITISAAGAFNGHLGSGHQNGEDIIPPFEFMGQTYSQNWDAEGQAVYRNNCVVNDKGHITIIKDAHPNDAQDFHFTTTGQGLSNFTLDDDSNATLSNSKEFHHLNAGTYTVTEAEVAGWDLDTIHCSHGANVHVSGTTLTIHLTTNQHASCTFHNDKELPLVITTGGGGGGAVLGASTTATVLANTGSPTTIASFIAGAILLLLLALTRLARRSTAVNDAERTRLIATVRNSLAMQILFLRTKMLGMLESLKAKLRVQLFSPWTIPTSTYV